ncbi:MAG: hypothetical protein GF344_06590 [Chitinivibrionales bacterium]|nr:hypothetical protein [Chitinivibrionales bacterium]MBD3356594.1 hypothetical protein [Chitinivibrionales bacterium]
MQEFVELIQNPLAPAAGSQVIKRDSYARYVAIQELADRARREWEEISRKAERIYKEEKRRGYADGLAKAKADGSRLILDTIGHAHDFLTLQEDRIVATVLAALKKITAELDETALLWAVVKKALSLVSKESRVTLYVAHEQVDAIKSRLAELKCVFPNTRTLAILGRDNMKPTDCYIESPVGCIDANLEAQIETLFNVMSGYRKRSMEEFREELQHLESALSGEPAAADSKEDGGEEPR